MLLVRDPVTRRRTLVKCMMSYARLACFVLGIKVESISDDIPLEKLCDDTKERFLIVSNHLSYLDIIVYCSLFPGVYVTSKEVKRTPFLGTITDMAGCCYVDRRDKSNIAEEIKEIASVIRSGFNLALFPEATSTDGSTVLMFRRGLFPTAVEAGVRILPICLTYSKIDGKKVTAQNRDQLCWYGDMTFFPHLWGVCSLWEIKAKVKILKPIPTKADDDPTALANAAHQVVLKAFEPFV